MSPDYQSLSEREDPNPDAWRRSVGTHKRPPIQVRIRF